MSTVVIVGPMNAVGGGGSFVTLPALIFAGVPSVAANASILQMIPLNPVLL